MTVTTYRHLPGEYSNGNTPAPRYAKHGPFSGGGYASEHLNRNVSIKDIEWLSDSDLDVLVQEIYQLMDCLSGQIDKAHVEHDGDPPGRWLYQVYSKRRATNTWRQYVKSEKTRRSDEAKRRHEIEKIEAKQAAHKEHQTALSKKSRYAHAVKWRLLKERFGEEVIQAISAEGEAIAEREWNQANKAKEAQN